RVRETLAVGGKPRPDDTPETLRNRLAVYYKNTAPLLDYYAKQGKVSTVDGMAPIPDVAKAISAILDGVTGA
ncbi:MAG: adenylate kinase, partial [Alphaproteobacteria bacterium]|nr:adenylate kinase [Alphaproteobacteria bacterium]